MLALESRLATGLIVLTKYSSISMQSCKKSVKVSTILWHIALTDLLSVTNKLCLFFRFFFKNLLILDLFH